MRPHGPRARPPRSLTEYSLRGTVLVAVASAAVLAAVALALSHPLWTAAAVGAAAAARAGVAVPGALDWLRRKRRRPLAVPVPFTDRTVEV